MRKTRRKQFDVKIGDTVDHLYIQDMYNTQYFSKSGNKQYRKICKCLCSCGNIKEIDKGSIENRDAKSCGCIRYKDGKEHHGWKGYEEISGDFWDSFKRYASRKNEFNLTIEAVWDLFIKQDRKCAITGHKISFDKDRTNCTASIYRINAHKGFYIENIQWVHKDVAKRVRKGANNKRWRGYEGLSGSYWSSIINGAKQRNLELTITIKDAWELLLKQNKKCALSGVDLYFGDVVKYKKGAANASLDRIDNSKGYILGNVQWVHKEVNMIKFTHDEDKFIEWCHKISKYQLDKNKNPDL